MSGAAWTLFLVRRLAALVVLLVVVSFVVFSLLYLSPGSVLNVLIGPRPHSADLVRALEKEYHLDQPFFTQYLIWLRGAVQLHFGTSIQTSLPVTQEITARLPTSLVLGAYSFVLTIIVGVGLGTVAAYFRGTVLDRAIVASTVIGLSSPVFVVGVFLLYIFAVQLPWFPAFGKGSGFADEIWHLTLPAVALAVTSAAYVLKHARTSVIRVLEQDYVVFARARGVSSPRILFTYVLRNALIPIITISGTLLSALIVGAVLVEVTFSVQGVGQLLVQSATAQDIPMIQGVVLVVATIIVVANLVADIAYMFADPRIRLVR